MFQATRRRLALWYATATAVLLLLFATGFYLYVRATLIERVDDTLNHVVEVIERSLVFEVDRPVRLPEAIALRPNLEIAADGEPMDDDRIELEWFDARGTLVWSTFASTPDVPLLPRRAEQTVRIAADSWLRQLTTPVRAGDRLWGYLRVSHPWFEVTKPTRQLVRDLVAGGLLTVAFVGAVGWVLSGIAIQPVRESFQQLKQFTADASHELRSPIASIQTNVQVALADPDLDLQSRQSWQVVERLTQRLGGLVNDLLFLARQDGGVTQMQPQDIALDALLLSVVEEQRASATGRNVQLELDIAAPSAGLSADADIYGCWGDEDQLARLFTNLLDNAIAYTPADGSVRVRLAQLNSDDFQVAVTDTGAGIPESELPKLFDRFYRADAARSHGRTSGGTGLGLAIAKAIVEHHQGQIAVTSTLSAGTTFTVTLPVPRSGTRASP
ncbi:MAG: HAMP domain-containing sensor histidine kinase [Cyanobacteria bacterium P01_F01_bin.33]